MKGFLTLALGLALAACSFGAVIDISTGTGNANWQIVAGPVAGAYTGAAIDIQNPTNNANCSWVGGPTVTGCASQNTTAQPVGTDWVSWGATQGISCTTSATGPANGCASPSLNVSNGIAGIDNWTYQLTISAAALGATSGFLNYIFGSDNNVNVWVGSPTGQYLMGQFSGNNGYGALYCATPSGPTAIVGGNYGSCTAEIPFTSANLNADGSLTITAYDQNQPITTGSPCPTCYLIGNPSGFILDGTITTGASATPEPATFGLVGLAGLVGGLVLRRKKRA